MCNREVCMVIDDEDYKQYIENKNTIPIQETLKYYNPMEREFVKKRVLS